MSTEIPSDQLDQLPDISLLKEGDESLTLAIAYQCRDVVISLFPNGDYDSPKDIGGSDAWLLSE